MSSIKDQPLDERIGGQSAAREWSRPRNHSVLPKSGRSSVGPKAATSYTTFVRYLLQENAMVTHTFPAGAAARKPGGRRYRTGL